MTNCVGIVSPGAMGAAVGSSLAGCGMRVLVALEGRSERSRLRAREAALEDVSTLDELVGASDVVLSIVPPASATEVATAMAEALLAHPGTRTIVDANAISPMRAAEIAARVEAAGGQYVDGAIVGGPPRTGRRTDFFVSGRGSDRLAMSLSTPELIVTSLGSDPTAASTLKMCYAAWTKGTSALLIAIRGLARARGLDAELIALWGRTQPTVLARSDGESGIASRAWRWVDEMSEIARTFEDAGLPGGSAEAAARLYERLAVFKDREVPPTLEEMLSELVSEPG